MRYVVKDDVEDVDVGFVEFIECFVDDGFVDGFEVVDVDEFGVEVGEEKCVWEDGGGWCVDDDEVVDF